jgi:hypothetical protein
MQLPSITATDLSLQLAIAAITLLISAELSAPYYGLTNLTVNKKKLKKAALVTSALFLVTVVIQLVNMLTRA